MSYEDQNSLNDLDVATPLDGASPQELLAAFRQLKAVVKNALLTSHHPDGRIRGTAVSTIPVNSVGANQIMNGGVVEDKLANLSVSSGKMQAGAVVADKIGAGAVTEAKYGAASIPTGAFKTNSVPLSALNAFIGRANLASSPDDDEARAVTEEAIADLAVVDRAVKSVDVSKLTGGDDDDTVQKINGIWTAVPKTDFDPTLQVAIIGDLVTRGTSGGEAAADNVWAIRKLSQISDPFNFVSFSGSHFTLTPGKYFIHITVPAKGVGRHQARLVSLEANFTTILGVPIWGTSAETIVLSTPTYSNSVVLGLVEVTQANKWFRLDHHVQTKTGTADYGVAANSSVETLSGTVYTPVEIYTHGFIIKYD